MTRQYYPPDTAGYRCRSPQNKHQVMAEKKIRIAIVGGGLGGTCMAHALIRKPNLDVHVYEAAPEFSERGAAVGLPSHAIGALEAIIPSARDVVLNKAGAVPSNSSRMMLVSHPQICSNRLSMPGKHDTHLPLCCTGIWPTCW